MLNLIRARIRHGYQGVRDIRGSVIDTKFRGFPEINQHEMQIDANHLAEQCPVKAIIPNPLSIDIGKCIFCEKCQRLADYKGIKFSNLHKHGADSRNKLVIQSGQTFADYSKNAVTCRKEIKRVFGKSLKLRSVSAGGCNACEMELNACNNVNFDMSRYGIEMAASPRHADGLVITGPITKNMSSALMDTYYAMPSPKIIIAVGSCAISGGLFSGSPAVDRTFYDKVKPDLYIPGCPPHPLSIINGILDYIGRK